MIRNLLTNSVTVTVPHGRMWKVLSARQGAASSASAITANVTKNGMVAQVRWGIFDSGGSAATQLTHPEYSFYGMKARAGDTIYGGATVYWIIDDLPDDGKDD